MFTRISTSIRFYLLLFVLTGCDSSTQPAFDAQQQNSTVKEEKTTKLVQEPKAAFKNSKEAFGFLQTYADQADLHNRFVIETKYGRILIKLFDNTPLHKANFNYLVKKDYFNNTWFYRVSAQHVIQAGNTDGIPTLRKRKAIGDYLLPAELNSNNLHTAGAVAAARSYKANPDKESDPYEFYIVVGKSYSEAQLKALAEEYDFELSPEKIKAYAEQGGSPHLDGEHTVFGRVVEGMDVVYKISKLPTDEGEWPLENIPIQIKPLP